MFGSFIFLKINTSATKIFFKTKEYLFIFLDKFYVEFRFHSNPSFRHMVDKRILNVDSKASFTIN